MAPRRLVRSLRIVVTAFAMALCSRLVSAEPGLETAPAEGELELLTYNVAGLPEGVSASHPSANMTRIGELLNEYDVALVQEDFAYSAELRQNLRLAYASAPAAGRAALDFGDGLSQFARAPFSAVLRSAWRFCNGYLSDGCDCLARKGFALARTALSARASVDIYNLHMDSGDEPEDRAARAKQLEQLAAAIGRYSSGRAVIVAGDTNLARSERRVLGDFLRRTKLSDACETAGCRDLGRIDRVLFRGSSELELRVRSWHTDPRFVDAERAPLSDHLPVAVAFGWKVRALEALAPPPNQKRRPARLSRTGRAALSALSSVREPRRLQ
jgi:endonuclease/exonuclease/phosphatase family metal-dependent hydrolase